MQRLLCYLTLDALAIVVGRLDDVTSSLKPFIFGCIVAGCLPEVTDAFAVCLKTYSKKHPFLLGLGPLNRFLSLSLPSAPYRPIKVFVLSFSTGWCT